MHDFLYGFLTWFKAFFDNMLGGVLMVVKGIVLGIIKIFNLPYYFKIWADEAPNFGVFLKSSYVTTENISPYLNM